MPEPIIISTKEDTLYGILRENINAEILYILLPANSGTRIGPQRIFVEISEALLKNNISTFCLDLPPLGDSVTTIQFKKQEYFFDSLTEKYAYYIDQIIAFFTKNRAFKKVGLLSISYGCLPCYNYAINNREINSLILLSPDVIVGSLEKINKKNLRNYFLKLVKTETIRKLFSLKLNLKKIVHNIFLGKNRKEQAIRKMRAIKNADLEIISFFGEKDDKKDHLLKCWEHVFSTHQKEKCMRTIIQGSDHSFFGWQFKKAVINEIINWSNKTQSN